MLAELVSDPQPYFRERIKYPSLRIQTLIVAVAGLAANVWHLALFAPLGASSRYVESVLLIFTGIGIIEFIGWWVILTGVMHVIANVLGGDSSYGGLLRLTGYGFVPMIVGGAIWSVSYFVSLQNAAPPAPPRLRSFQYQLETFNEYMTQTAGDPIVLGGLAVGSLFVLAAGYLWLQAVTVGADLESDSAGIAAGAAVLIVLARLFVPVV